MTDKKPREWLIRPDGDGAIHVVEISALLEAQAEIARLTKIIAKELNENDELGCEFTYVNFLKEENQRLREALEKIRDLEFEDQNVIIVNGEETITSASEIARAALGEIT